MAIIDLYCEKAIDFAKTLNPDIKIDSGINWIWASGFNTNEEAEKFDNFCTSNGCETRGVYQRDENTFDVRFR